MVGAVLMEAKKKKLKRDCVSDENMISLEFWWASSEKVQKYLDLALAVHVGLQYFQDSVSQILQCCI